MSTPPATLDGPSPSPVEPTERLVILDSIRGLASLVVLTYHTLGLELLNASQAGPWAASARRLWSRFPLRFLWDGGAAVILFFVLSGFVLSLPYYSGRNLTYPRYLVRRFFRIYVPYAVAILIGFGLRGLVDRGPVSGFAPEHGEIWSAPITSKNIINEILLIYKSDQTIDPVTWTLAVEMRLSIAFPLLMALVLRFNAALALAASLAISAALLRLNQVVSEETSWDTDVLDSSRYIIPFVLGALAARYRIALIRSLSPSRPAIRSACIILGFLLYTYAPTFGTLLTRLLPGSFSVFVIALRSGGSAILCIWALDSRMASLVLESRPLVYLGRISYSLYLYHMIVFTVLMKTIRTAIPAWGVCLLAFVLSLIVAPVAYRLVEAPAMTLGRRLTRRR